MLCSSDGGVQTVSGIEEIVQRAMIRLTMKKGSFLYDETLGSELRSIDINKLNKKMLLSKITDALDGIDELEVLDIEESLNRNEQILYVTIYMRAKGQDAILEINLANK